MEDFGSVSSFTAAATCSTHFACRRRTVLDVACCTTDLAHCYLFFRDAWGRDLPYVMNLTLITGFIWLVSVLYTNMLRAVVQGLSRLVCCAGSRVFGVQAKKGVLFVLNRSWSRSFRASVARQRATQCFMSFIEPCNLFFAKLPSFQCTDDIYYFSPPHTFCMHGTSSALYITSYQ